MCFLCVWKWDIACLFVFGAAKLGGQTPKTYEDFELEVVVLAGRERGHEIRTAIESIKLIEEVSTEDNITRETWKNMKNGAKLAVIIIFLRVTIVGLSLAIAEVGKKLFGCRSFRCPPIEAQVIDIDLANGPRLASIAKLYPSSCPLSCINRESFSFSAFERHHIQIRSRVCNCH